MTLFNTLRLSITSCLLLFATALGGKTWAVAQASYIYREQTEEQQVEYTWTLEQRDDLFVISSKQPNKQFQTVCTADGATLSWTLQNNSGENMTARRKGNILHLVGTIEGKTTEQHIAIDDRPWLQPLSFSLRSMVTGTTTEQDFWIIRPDTFAVVALKAEKKDCRTSTIKKELDDLCEIEIKKSGWLAPFWRASYWFRQSDGLFVEYRGVHGLPGTSETVIQLIR